MLYLLVLMIHVGVCLGLILVVLMQSSKGGGLSGVFGGSSQAVFGGRGAAPALVKVTSVLAIAFGLTSLSTSFLSTKQRVAKTAIQQEIEKGTKRSSPLQEHRSRLLKGRRALEINQGVNPSLAVLQVRGRGNPLQ